jgi:hypothetical protein
MPVDVNRPLDEQVPLMVKWSYVAKQLANKTARKWKHVSVMDWTAPLRAID